MNPAIWRADAARVFGFDAEVHLLVQAGLELVDHLREAVACADGGVAAGELGDLAQYLQVDFDALPNARALDLDRHLRAVAQHRAMDLRHRRGRQRQPVELEEQLFERGVELRLNDLHDALGGNGLNGVLEARQSMDVVRRQEVRARAEQLAELDEARPELLEGAGELGAVVVLGVRVWVRVGLESM